MTGSGSHSQERWRKSCGTESQKAVVGPALLGQGRILGPGPDPVWTSQFPHLWNSGAGEGGGARDISEVFSSSRVPSSLSSVGALMVRYRGVWARLPSLTWPPCPQCAGCLPGGRSWAHSPPGCWLSVMGMHWPPGATWGGKGLENLKVAWSLELHERLDEVPGPHPQFNQRCCLYVPIWRKVAGTKTFENNCHTLETPPGSRWWLKWSKLVGVRKILCPCVYYSFGFFQKSWSMREIFIVNICL